MQTPQQKLAELGLELPAPSAPGGKYESVNIRGGQATVAIQFPILNGEYHFQGRLGAELSRSDGQAAMQLCALNVLAQIDKSVGFENVIGLNHLDAHYCAVDSWDEAPAVVDAASSLFVEVLGSKGRHSRSIYGVANLPRGFCIGLTVSLSVQL